MYLVNCIKSDNYVSETSLLINKTLDEALNGFIRLWKYCERIYFRNLLIQVFKSSTFEVHLKNINFMFFNINHRVFIELKIIPQMQCYENLP